MSRSNPETQNLILTVAGAANAGGGNHSTASVHFSVLRRTLQHDLQTDVTQPIVPAGFGLLLPLEKTYRHFMDDFERTTESYPNARILIIGHSLGGLLARRLIAEQSHDGPDRFIGAITLGTPHAGLKNRHIPIVSYKCGEFLEFANNIPLTGGELGQVQLAFVASSHDEIIPVSSALAPIEGAERYLIAKTELARKDTDGIINLSPSRIPILHNALPLAPVAIHLTASLARNMIQQTGVVPLQPVELGHSAIGHLPQTA